MDKLTIIKEMVCNDRDIMPHTLNSKTRKREVVLARQLCHYFARNYTKLSLSQIGNEIGQKDHATVIHGCRAINNLIETDKSFSAYVYDLEMSIKARVNYKTEKSKPKILSVRRYYNQYAYNARFNRPVTRLTPVV